MIDLAIDNRVFIDTELDEALQELDMLFNTENTELIGYPKYGTNFEQFLWNMNPSVSSLKSYIEERFADTFYINKMEHSINIQILNGEYRGIYSVEIVLYDKNTDQQGVRQYEFR